MRKTPDVIEWRPVEWSPDSQLPRLKRRGVQSASVSDKPISHLARRFPRPRPSSPSGWRASTILPPILLALLLIGYGIGLALFTSRLDDFTMRLADFLNHIELARRLATNTIEVNGFYPLGYPFLLGLVFNLAGDIFLAGKIVSGIAALVALAAVYHSVLALLGHNEWVLGLIAATTLGVSPVFVQYATTPGTDMAHVALMLVATAAILRAVDSPHFERWLMVAGLASGASYLIRYTSMLLLASFVIWLAIWRPFPGRLRQALASYGLAFGVAAAPQFVLSVLQHGTPFYTTTLAKNVWVGIYGGPQPEPIWGRVADAISLESVISFDIWRFLISWAINATQPVIVNDIVEVITIVSGLLGTWTSPVPVAVAVSSILPKLLKVVAVIGLFMLALRGDGTQETEARGGFLMLFTIIFVWTTAMAFITDRHLLMAVPLLVIAGFGAAGMLVTPRLTILLGILASAMLIVHLWTFDYVNRWMIGYDHGRQVTERLRPFRPQPGEVLGSNWVFYDYDSAWRDKYIHIPVYIDSVPALINDMRRRGARFVVLDRNAGRAEWPGLEPLLNLERPPTGLRPIGPAIYTREWPPNEIVIYTLEP